MNNDINSVNDNEEYSPYILSLTDEDGKEFSFEVLDDIDFEDERYMALLPQYDDPAKMLESSGELVILKIITEDGEDSFVEIEDDDEYERVASVFTDRLQDLFEIE